MKELLRRIEEARDGLGGWLNWEYTDGNSSWICGSFDVDTCLYNSSFNRFIFNKKRPHETESHFVLDLSSFTNIERYYKTETNNIMIYSFCCMLPGDTMGTSKKNIDIDVYVIMKPYNIKTFFRMIKNKLKRK